MVHMQSGVHHLDDPGIYIARKSFRFVPVGPVTTWSPSCPNNPPASLSTSTRWVVIEPLLTRPRIVSGRTIAPAASGDRRWQKCRIDQPAQWPMTTQILDCDRRCSGHRVFDAGHDPPEPQHMSRRIANRWSPTGNRYARL